MPKMGYYNDASVVSGKQGNEVYATGRSGGVRRRRTIPTNPNTPAQAAARQAFTHGTIVYSQLPSGLVVQWEQYAATIHVTDPITGKTYSPAPGTVFVGLASKFLHVTPTGTVPTTPPTGTFSGDAVTVSAVQEDGGIGFTASAANESGIKTELLFQKLPSTNRQPGKENYRTLGFVAYAAGHLSQAFPLAFARYAVAYRFVLTTTGQTSRIVRLGVIDVS